MDKYLVTPEEVLLEIYGRTSLETGLTEKRRDELIAAAIFTSFRNQEFGTRFHLPLDYRNANLTEDAMGIDVTITDITGRKKELQIKGIYIHRSIERRRHHNTKGVAKVTGRRTWRIIQRDSLELTKIMRKELEKIVQDYSGFYLIIHVIADLATQTSLGIAIKNSRDIVSNLKAKEVWFLRHVPVRVIRTSERTPQCYAYQLIRVSPERHTYTFSFSL